VNCTTQRACGRSSRQESARSDDDDDDGGGARKRTVAWFSRRSQNVSKSIYARAVTPPRTARAATRYRVLVLVEEHGVKDLRSARPRRSQCVAEANGTGNGQAIPSRSRSPRGALRERRPAGQLPTRAGGQAQQRNSPGNMSPARAMTELRILLCIHRKQHGQTLHKARDFIGAPSAVCSGGVMRRRAMRPSRQRLRLRRPPR
jgi:hypothetical protein